jgi:hypothetical protein
LVEGLRPQPLVPGRQIFILFTDADNRPAAASPSRGKSFEALVAGTKLPADTEVVIRFYGKNPPAVSRNGFSVLAAAPDWKAVLRLTRPAPLPPPAPDFPRWLLWSTASIGLVILSAVALMLIRKRQKQPDADLEADVEQPTERQPIAEPQELLVYAIQAKDSGQIAELDGMQKRELLVGDSVIADMPLPEPP